MFPSLAQWAAGHGITATPGVDTDNDGWSDIEEYYADTNPRSGDARVGGMPGQAPELLIADDATIYGFDLHLSASRALRRTSGEKTAKVSLEESRDMLEWERWSHDPEITIKPGYPGWEFWHWWPRL